MNIRRIRGVKVLLATGSVLFVATFALTTHFSVTAQKQDGITIVPVLTSHKYPILLPTATSKATIDVKAPVVTRRVESFPRQI